MQENLKDFGINLSSCRRLAVRTALLGAVALAGVACSSTKPAPMVTTTTAPAERPIASSGPVSPQGETQEQILQRIIAMLASNSIYFDYNTYTIKPEYQTALQKDFDALKSMPPVSLRLEGNADERGSAEYNLALGQKRAEAVRQALHIMGMADANVEAVSFGKEKPKAECHDESCWSQNRRVDLAVKR
jgi:peptidoglycan-associated lipoprotein